MSRPEVEITDIRNITELVKRLYNYDFSNYKNKAVIIKGCSDKFIPKSSYSALIEKLQSISKSIMFGEACSAVPIYKKPKN